MYRESNARARARIKHYCWCHSATAKSLSRTRPLLYGLFVSKHAALLAEHNFVKIDHGSWVFARPGFRSNTFLLVLEQCLFQNLLPLICRSLVSARLKASGSPLFATCNAGGTGWWPGRILLSSLSKFDKNSCYSWGQWACVRKASRCLANINTNDDYSR